MDNLSALSVVALAALIHASFQLGVSVVTLLSGHTAGKRVNPRKTLRLTGAFLAGSLVITSLISLSLLYLATTLDIWQQPATTWSVVSIAMILLGFVVWLSYYRRGNGTVLWIPRSFARFLDKRVRTTTLSAEAFSLGVTTVISELPFIAAPSIAAALALVYLPSDLQLLGVLGYILIASLGVIVITALIGSGHNLSHIQRWRESNKHFLQFAAGSGLVILGFYLYVNQVVATAQGVL